MTATLPDPAPDRVLLAVTGSIAALAVPNHVFTLRAMGFRHLSLLLTHTGRRFLTEDAGRAIFDQVYLPEDTGAHVSIAREHQVLVVLPASAHTLAYAAAAQAPNLLGTVLLAYAGPVLFAPAMNLLMWQNKGVQRNVRQLRADGHVVLDPVPGRLWECASGQMVDGLGLADPPAMAAAIARVAAARRRAAA